MIKPYFETELGKLYNCDCLEFMKTIPDGSVDLVLTDPPYGIDITEIWGAEKFGYKQYEQDRWVSDEGFYGSI